MVVPPVPKPNITPTCQPALKKESPYLISKSRKGAADVKDYFIIYNQNI